MAARPARHLRPVTPAEEAKADAEEAMKIIDAQGEVVCTVAEYMQPIRDQLTGAERDNRGWAQRYAELKRDKEAEMKGEENWPAALRVFTYWRTTCSHPRSTFDHHRYELVAKILEAHKDGSEKLKPYERAEALCRKAIDGAAFDPFTKPMKNGATKRYDDFDLIFRNADKFEGFCNRAPRRTDDDDDAAKPAAPEPDRPSGGEQSSLLPSENETAAT